MLEKLCVKIHLVVWICTKTPYTIMQSVSYNVM